MFKTFTTRYGTDAVDKIEQLRVAFPGCKFAAGMSKGTKGIFAFSSDIKEYGEHFALENGDEFWLPTAANLLVIRESLPKHKTQAVDRVAVKLKKNITLDIFPASAIPKVALLGTRRNRVQTTEEAAYDKNNKYGLMAYQFYQKSIKDEDIRFDNDEFQNFIRQALVESYTLPIDIFDALEIISLADFEGLFAAAMGYDIDYLRRVELPLSNGDLSPASGKTSP